MNLYSGGLQQTLFLFLSFNTPFDSSYSLKMLTYFYSWLSTLIPKVKSSHKRPLPLFDINFWASKGALICGFLWYKWPGKKHTSIILILHTKEAISLHLSWLAEAILAPCSFWYNFLWTKLHGMGSYWLDGGVLPWQISWKAHSYVSLMTLRLVSCCLTFVWPQQFFIGTTDLKFAHDNPSENEVVCNHVAVLVGGKTAETPGAGLHLDATHVHRRQCRPDSFLQLHLRCQPHLHARHHSSARWGLNDRWFVVLYKRVCNNAIPGSCEKNGVGGCSYVSVCEFSGVLPRAWC